MEDLLRNEYTAHYGLPVCNEPNLVIQTNETYFEIEDTEAKEIVLHTLVGQGMARFSNPNSIAITIANYDKFVTSLPNDFQRGKDRCDILLVSQSQFVLGELKNRNIINPDKRKEIRRKAKEQLFKSLIDLLAVPRIKTLVNSKNVRKCCYFNRQSKAPNILTATTAFNRLSLTFQDGFQMSHLAIESQGFEFWEYLGEHTLTLT